MFFNNYFIYLVSKKMASTCLKGKRSSSARL